MTTPSFEVDQNSLNDGVGIESRAAAVPESERAILRHVLQYMYLSDGPTTVTREQRSQAEPKLTPVERFVLQWMFKRTDGKLRRFYGEAALVAAKAARYRCEQCGFSDVRALNLERQEPEEKDGKPTFVCLCANCNTVAARAKEMAHLESQHQAVRDSGVSDAGARDSDAESTKKVEPDAVEEVAKDDSERPTPAAAEEPK